ncbi:hypothetical protein C1645_877593 [Glomus cerebriforme]|uniref:Uncharacterized protein n=1 Tax=Glomus cerebriforme TaxID=658196 RepID=A0A397SWD9_9GLOM|nr:hypothetical protein C1645_877593 [Glomus cerebriforme]
MSNPLLKVKILLDRNEPSERLHVIVLDCEAHIFLNVKISSPEEIVKKKYKDILNAYMLFRIDFCDAFNVAKSNEKFCKNSEVFKDTSLLWKNSPKEVTDEYERVFANYKKLKPKVLNFITYKPQENKSGNNNAEISEIRLDQVNLCNNTNDLISQPEIIQVENPGVLENLSDNINFLTFNTQLRNNTNSQPEIIHFETPGVMENLSDNINYLISQSQYLSSAYISQNESGSSGSNNEPNVDQINLISQPESIQFENSDNLSNINYFTNFVQYVDNITYNTEESENCFNSDYGYEDSTRSMIQPSGSIVNPHLYVPNSQYLFEMNSSSPK